VADLNWTKLIVAEQSKARGFRSDLNLLLFRLQRNLKRTPISINRSEAQPEKDSTSETDTCARKNGSIAEERSGAEQTDQ
jgi:hypothetical protein